MPEPEVNSSPPSSVARPGGGPVRAKNVVANAQGLLALLLIAIFVEFVYSRSGRRTGDFAFDPIILLLLYAGSWLFAIGGTRRGTGAGKIVAISALGILIASVVFVLVFFVHSL
jgi:hypothetical protein